MTESVDVSLLSENNAVLVSTECIFDLDTLSLEIIHHFGSFNFGLVTVTKLALLVLSISVKISKLKDKDTLTLRQWRCAFGLNTLFLLFLGVPV